MPCSARAGLSGTSMFLLRMKRAGRRSSMSTLAARPEASLQRMSISMRSSERPKAMSVPISRRSSARQRWLRCGTSSSRWEAESEQERKDAIKNVMLTKAHFDAAVSTVKGSLDGDAIEKSERQSWEMLYNQEQREILENALRSSAVPAQSQRNPTRLPLRISAKPHTRERRTLPGSRNSQNHWRSNEKKQKTTTR